MIFFFNISPLRVTHLLQRPCTGTLMIRPLTKPIAITLKQETFECDSLHLICLP